MQPPNKPSTITFFATYLKLNQILAFALRTIYATNKAKAKLGFVGHQWDQHIVAELDSALNKWFDDIPDHLRWDPSQEDKTFATQSTCIQTSYYQLQILIHRPFISPAKLSPLSFSSLAVCTNAARSCIHVCDIQRRRSNVPLPHLHAALFTAGVTLLLSIWGSKRSGLIDADKEIEDVHKCMAALKVCENRWYSAGRLWDILCGLAHAGGFPLPKSPGSVSKRARDSDIPGTVYPSTVSSTSKLPLTEGPRTIAGSKRASKINIFSPQPTSMAALQSGSLPMYDRSDQLPVQGQVHVPSNRSTRTQGDSWSSALGDPTAVPVQQHISNAHNGSNAFDGLLTPAFSVDPVFYRQMGYDIPSSSNQAPSGGQRQYNINSQQLHSLVGVESNQEQLQVIDDEAFAVWNSVPGGFELDEWGTYMNQLSYNQQADEYES